MRGSGSPTRKVGQAPQQLGEDRLELKPRERRPHAVVRSPAAETDVVVWLTQDIEAAGILERPLIPVRRGVEEQ